MPNGEHAERIAVHDSQIEDVRNDISELRGCQDASRKESAQAHANLGSKIHQLELKVETRFTAIETSLGTWGKALTGLIAIVGVVIPIVLHFV